MAANRIKGITIEIDGDTSKLTNSLKNVDKSLKDTQNKLKDVEKLLKLDPGNTELLRQKFEGLQTAINTTEERLKMLKDAQQEGMDPEQADALQREIIATEQSLKDLKDQMSDFGSVTKQQMQVAGENVSAVGEKIKEVGGKIQDFGKEMTAKVTGPIVAAGAASMAAWGEVDEAMDTVVKKTGATGETLASLQQSVSNVARSIPTDFATAGNAIGEVNTRFGLMGDELEDVTEAFIKYSQLNNTDVVSSIDSVQKAMTAWGFAAEDANDVLDVLNYTGQETGISADSLSDALGSNAAVLRDAGMDFLQAADFIGNLEKNGIDASTAMTGLKKATQNASKEGKTSAQVLQELANNIKNAESDAEAFNLASDVFGTKAGPALALALQEDRLSFEDLGHTWDEVGGNVQTTFDNTIDPVDSLTLIMNSVKETLADIGSVIQEIAVPALEKIQEVVQTLREKWDGLDEDKKKNIVTIAAIVAAIGPVIAIIGTVISVIGSVVGAIGTVMSALGTVVGFLGGPLTIAIGAIIAIGVLLWKNWDTVKAKAIELWNKLRETWENIKNTISEKVTAIKDKVTSIFDNIKSTIQARVDLIKSIVGAAFDIVKGKIITPIENAKEKVREIVDKIKGFFSGLSISLPHIKLPHFKISGKFSLNPPQVPRFGIDWYAKAMRDGMILNGPTIFGMNSRGDLMAGGEAGREVVVGANSLMGMIQKATAGTRSDINVSVVVNGNVDNYDALAETIGQKLQQQMARQGRAFA